MANKIIKFRMTAYSAAAGKYNPAAPLDGNEDNFFVDDNLSDSAPGSFHGDNIMDLSECGCLMVVADGMGGMNAGEVASEIAVSTVKELFSADKISEKMASSPSERRKYMEQVIKTADSRIKQDAAENPEHDGMGSTIIMAWIVGNQVTVSWCGDSRAYRYNAAFGIEALSCDHSYVQELANKGVITYEDTFEHPQGNIVTRSLGDPNGAAKPESKDFEIYDGDIILLCSDGLSGVLRDRKTKAPDGSIYPGENIEDIIATHTDSISACRDALMDAAEKADWYDNVTVLLCQIVSGAGAPPKDKQPYKQILPGIENVSKTGDTDTKSTKNNKIIYILAGLLLIAIVACVFFFLSWQNAANESEENKETANEEKVEEKSEFESELLEGVENEGIEREDNLESKQDAKSVTEPSREGSDEKDVWRISMINRLDKVDPVWHERVTKLKREINSRNWESNRVSIEDRVSTLERYDSLYKQVRELIEKLSGERIEAAKNLLERIKNHTINFEEAEQKIQNLSKAVDTELTEAPSLKIINEVIEKTDTAKNKQRSAD